MFAVVDTSSDISEPPPSPTTSPYERLKKALQTDPRCSHEVALGRRVGLYKFCGDIGRGNFSKVKLGIHQLTQDKVAIKVVDRGGLDTRAQRMLSREIITLECVHHPNILRLFEVVETIGRVYLVTEFVRGGELYNHITQAGPLKEVHAAPLYKQLLLAVKHMHSLGFVHRDIKAENVLLVTEDRLKLADFGFSTELFNGHNQKLDTFCGSPPYAAPELFSDDHYIGQPVDVWALGVLLYFMVVGNMPFRAPSVPSLRAAVLKGDYSLPGHITLPCVRIIQRILIHIPARRPNIDEIIACQFITYPNLSIDLMTSQIRLLSKPVTKRSPFWFRNKSHRLRKTCSIRDRYLEISNKPPYIFNTKKNDGIFNDKFLHPIDVASLYAEIEQNTISVKHSFFTDNLKKRIGPIENEKDKYSPVRTIKLSNDKNCISEIQSPKNINKNYDEEIGKFIILPTDINNCSELNSLEIEARKILEQLGVTGEMLQEAISCGPRSEIIGAYRIIVNRLQKQAWVAKRLADIEAQELKKPKKRRRNCTIL